MKRTCSTLAAALWLSLLIPMIAAAQRVDGPARRKLINDAREQIFSARKFPKGSAVAEIRSRTLEGLHERALPKFAPTDLPFTLHLRVNARDAEVSPEEPVVPDGVPDRQRVVDTLKAHKEYVSMAANVIFTIDDAALPRDPERCTVVKDSAGYLLTFVQGWERHETRLDQDLRVIRTEARMGRFRVTVDPAFNSTPLGLVVDSAHVVIYFSPDQSVAGTFDLKTRYTVVDGMPLPAGAHITGRDALVFREDGVRSIAIDDVISIDNYSFGTP